MGSMGTMRSEPLAGPNVNTPKKRIILLVLLLAPLSGAAATSFTTKPFWEGKPKLEVRLREERAILVSVRTERGTVDKSADRFSINGVGHVRRDADTVYSLAKQFDRLKEISDVFQIVKYEPKTNRVFVICEALGYQARMLIRVDPTVPPVREIQFKVIEGHFVGLAGVMAFRELAGGKTEASLRVSHEAREIPIPRILVGFALEVLIQKVAAKMRTHFEVAPETSVRATGKF